MNNHIEAPVETIPRIRNNYYIQAVEDFIGGMLRYLTVRIADHLISQNSIDRKT